MVQSKSKTKKKPEKAKAHVCGAINGVMGKGAFSKEGDKYRCVECGKVLTELPQGYMVALKKLSPKRATLLEKGAKRDKDAAKNPVMVEAGKKAWITRRANEAAAENKNNRKAKK